MFGRFALVRLHRVLKYWSASLQVDKLLHWAPQVATLEDPSTPSRSPVSKSERAGRGRWPGPCPFPPGHSSSFHLNFLAPFRVWSHMLHLWWFCHLWSCALKKDYLFNLEDYREIFKLYFDNAQAVIKVISRWKKCLHLNFAFTSWPPTIYWKWFQLGI